MASVKKYNRFKKNNLSLSILMVGLSYGSSYAFAEEVFNPAFLDDGDTDMQISDLSKFNQIEYKPPGVYRVEIYVNGSRIRTQDISFVEKEKENENDDISKKRDAKSQQCLDIRKPWQ